MPSFLIISTNFLNNMLVKDKVVIITGGGSGIGEACARLFAQHKAKVVVSDINLAQAERVAADITQNGGTAIALQTDVTQYEQVENLILKTIEAFQKLDVMVNNAGIGGKNQYKTAEHTLDDWHNVIAVNQTGVWQYCQHRFISWLESIGQ